jgi:MFS family permease
MGAEQPGTGGMAAAANLRWGNRIIMICGGALVTLALTALASVMPQMELALASRPEDTLWVKQIVGVIGLSIIIGAPLTGFLIDRISIKLILIVSCLVVAMAGVSGLFIDNLPLLVATRFITDAAAVGVATCSMTLINTRLAADERPRWMGYHVSVYMASGIVYYPIAGWLGEMGWRMPFLMYLLAVPLLFVVLFGFKEPAVIGSERAGTAPASTPGPRFIDWFPFRFIVLGFLVGCALYLPAIYTPFTLRAIGLTSPQAISLVLSGSAVIPALAAYGYGPARRLLSAPGIFAVAFGFVGTGGIIVSLADNVVMAVVGLAFYSVGLGLMVPNLMTALGQIVTREHQGRAVGIVKGSQYIANTAVPFMIEPFARLHGPKMAFVASALLGTVLLVLFGSRALLERSRASVRPR